MPKGINRISWKKADSTVNESVNITSDIVSNVNSYEHNWTGDYFSLLNLATYLSFMQDLLRTCLESFLILMRITLRQNLNTGSPEH